MPGDEVGTGRDPFAIEAVHSRLEKKQDAALISALYQQMIALQQRSGATS